MFPLKKVGLSIVMSNYQRANLHFPMVFLWFSYGFQWVFLWFSYGFLIVIDYQCLACEEWHPQAITRESWRVPLVFGALHFPWCSPWDCGALGWCRPSWGKKNYILEFVSLFMRTIIEIINVQCAYIYIYIYIYIIMYAYIYIHI